MDGLQPLVGAWKESGIQVMVLLSFAVQVTLLTFADIRRYRNSSMLKAIIWSAYVLADTTAIYALGHMSLVIRSPDQHLMALWAPLLLVHLGRQDNITAYAVEDNRLWLRHLQNFGVQVAAAAYVLYVSTVLNSQTLLRSATIILFVVGVLKYGERVFALLCASNCASSSLSATSYKDFLDRHKRPNARSWVGVVPERNYHAIGPTRGLPPRHRVELEAMAYTLLDVPKKMFEGPTRYVEIQGDHRLGGQEMLEVVIMQLSMMYDLLYTKAAVVHTWYGCCIRAFSLPATVVALVQFHLHVCSNKDGGYSRADVAATYVLLGGAVVVETTSAVRALCSCWTRALLVKGKWQRLGRAVYYIEELVWSPMKLALRITGTSGCSLGSMGQENLFRLCTSSRNNRSSKIARWIGRDDRWDSMFYSWSISVHEEIMKAVLRYVLTLDTSGNGSEHDMPKSRGEKTLQGQAELLWSVKLELDESILVWHIATHIYTRWLRENMHSELTFSMSINYILLAEVLSNYMFYLLAARPYMLPYPVSRHKYVQLCYDVITAPADKNLLGHVEEQARARASTWTELIGEFKIDYPVEPLQNETLAKGCWLAIELIGRQANGFPVLNAIVCSTWVEMLCYSAYWCNENFLAKHLNDGGDLMTTVALFMVYFSKGVIK